ncbi:DUF305 domain-containing protein [Nocardia uniformis]|uniref:DUF305 domain-containing protein n=1 Tax=Nocardia uniformis TaxID=53432 RepID=A0A849CAH9_9NOCA|nr:DUF305 domain-containing protein [Nocardia uniformis]NNH69961.1 DUF305 domain-containing protein [Nocardia uniformis]
MFPDIRATSTRIKLAAITGISAIALIAAGCSGDDSGSSTPSTNHDTTSTSASAATRTDFNSADVTFLEMMYPHHAQAVEMAKLVPTRSQNQQVVALAQAIEQAQAPEMQQITTLLVSFGEPAPSQDGHGGGHGSMPGMMMPEQMTALELASGPAFDKKWLDMMIEHHQGAVTMSNTELAEGVNPDARTLAQAIVAAQQTEIDQMRTMLTQL